MNNKANTPVHTCGETADGMVYVATYGAPGIGQAWECATCQRPWARVGGLFFDPSEGVHIGTLADFE